MNRGLSFEKDVQALKEALNETDDRIKTLEGHMESEKKKIGDKNSETLHRLERNLENLHKKRALILSEME